MLTFDPTLPQHKALIWMENWDEDFSTLKGPPRFNSRQRSLSSWKTDIPLADGDQTLRRNQSSGVTNKVGQSFENRAVKAFEDSFGNNSEEDYFAEEFESAIRNRKSQTYTNKEMPDAFLSDSSSRSPGRVSISSAVSVSSAATSWDCENEFGFEFDEDEMPDSKIDLAAMFKARQEKAQVEAQSEASQLAANYAKAVYKNRLFEKRFENIAPDTEDDLLDLGLEQLTLRVKNGSVNQNIKLQPITTSYPHSPSKLLRGMRSIAQLPRKPSEASLPAPRLRGAVSMFDLGKHSQANLHNLRPSAQFLPSTGSLKVESHRQRPLTAYKEPLRPPRLNLRKPKSKKLNLISNPAPQLTWQERNGMVLNPQTGQWEGNDIDISRFDTEQAIKPTLITKQVADQALPKAAPNGMLFDNRTLSWVYANEEEYEDPFAEIDEIQSTPISTPSSAPFTHTPSHSPTRSHSHSLQYTPSQHFNPQKALRPQSSRIFTNESAASSASFASTTGYGRTSVTRSETSAREVFEVTPRMAAEWKHADERFMRKFGRWIGGDEEKADALQSGKHFYEMVKNA